MNSKQIIIVSVEPYSVFFEILFKSIKKVDNSIILIASKKLLLKQMKQLNYKFQINSINKDKLNLGDLKKKYINLIDVNFEFIKTFDKISNKSNIYINECFKIALNLLRTNQYSGMINGPISKKNFLKGKYLGITEYLGSKTKSKTSMLIYNKELSVCPITTHLALKDVCKNISKKKIIDQVILIQKFYKKRFKKKARIAITGLNPHCESFSKNNEEEKFIIPAIKFLKKKGFNVNGPFPADTIFMKDQIKIYDVVVGMYHDQVLTPVKTLFNFDAINITLGLPFLRITPDHGPNSKMLGKNKSNPQSLIQALRFLDNKCI
jgi:4-hydroxythreonine-4-phosphate dehydrogenase